MRIFLGDKSYDISFQCILLCFQPYLFPLQKGFHHIMVVLVLFLFLLFPEMQLFKYIHIPIQKRKKEKSRENFWITFPRSGTYLLFGNCSCHTWVTYTPLNSRLDTMIGKFTATGLAKDILQREGLVSSKEIK